MRGALLGHTTQKRGGAKKQRRNKRRRVIRSPSLPSFDPIPPARKSGKGRSSKEDEKKKIVFALLIESSFSAASGKV